VKRICQRDKSDENRKRYSEQPSTSNVTDIALAIAKNMTVSLILDGWCILPLQSPRMTISPLFQEVEEFWSKRGVAKEHKGSDELNHPKGNKNAVKFQSPV